MLRGIPDFQVSDIDNIACRYSDCMMVPKIQTIKTTMNPKSGVAPDTAWEALQYATHEQFDDDEQLVRGLPKARCGGRGGRATGSSARVLWHNDAVKVRGYPVPIPQVTDNVHFPTFESGPRSFYS